MQKYQIKIKAFNNTLLLLYKNFLISFLFQATTSFYIVNLPKIVKKFALLRSPHVNKKAQDHFCLNIFRFFICIRCNFKFLSQIILNKPFGLYFKVKLLNNKI